MTKSHKVKVQSRIDAKSAMEQQEQNRLRLYSPGPKKTAVTKPKHQKTKVVTLDVAPSYKKSSNQGSVNSSQVGQSKIYSGGLPGETPLSFQIQVSMKEGQLEGS